MDPIKAITDQLNSLEALLKVFKTIIMFTKKQANLYSLTDRL